MCHFIHLAKIPRMKSISKPPLPPEIYPFRQNLSTDDFRKESCVRWDLLTRSKLHWRVLDFLLLLIHGPMGKGNWPDIRDLCGTARPHDGDDSG